MKFNKCSSVYFVCSLFFASNFVSFGNQVILDNNSPLNVKIESNGKKKQIQVLNSSDSSSKECVELNMSTKVQERPVFHRIVRGDTLSELSLRYYGDGLKWRKIAEFPSNKSVVRGGGDKIYESDCLSIPQLPEAPHVLYNPGSGATFTSLATDFYGSCAWGFKLQRYNNAYSDNVCSDVVKLPKKICFGDYLTCNSDLNLYSLCHKLFGSEKYTKDIANFNNLNPSEPLESGKLIHIPLEFLKN